MRALVSVSAAALGASAWVPLSDWQNPFAVALFASFESGGSGTYKVQHTPDNPQDMRQPITITRSGTVATVKDTGHRLATGDNLQVFGSGDPNLDTVPGIGADVTVVDADTYTYVVANTGATASIISSTRIVTLRVYDHPQMTGLTARQDGNYAFPVRAVRARITTAGAGTLDLQVVQGAGR